MFAISSLFAAHNEDNTASEEAVNLERMIDSIIEEAFYRAEAGSAFWYCLEDTLTQCQSNPSFRKTILTAWEKLNALPDAANQYIQCASILSSAEMDTVSKQSVLREIVTRCFQQFIWIINSYGNKGNLFTVHEGLGLTINENDANCFIRQCQTLLNYPLAYSTIIGSFEENAIKHDRRIKYLKEIAAIIDSIEEEIESLADKFGHYHGIKKYLETCMTAVDQAQRRLTQQKNLCMQTKPILSYFISEENIVRLRKIQEYLTENQQAVSFHRQLLEIIIDAELDIISYEQLFARIAQDAEVMAFCKKAMACIRLANLMRTSSLNSPKSKIYHMLQKVSFLPNEAKLYSTHLDKMLVAAQLVHLSPLSLKSKNHILHGKLFQLIMRYPIAFYYYSHFVYRPKAIRVNNFNGIKVQKPVYSKKPSYLDLNNSTESDSLDSKSTTSTDTDIYVFGGKPTRRKSTASFTRLLKGYDRYLARVIPQLILQENPMLVNDDVNYSEFVEVFCVYYLSNIQVPDYAELSSLHALSPSSTDAKFDWVDIPRSKKDAATQERESTEKPSWIPGVKEQFTKMMRGFLDNTKPSPLPRR
jgi:exonuclease VII small subunit